MLKSTTVAQRTCASIPLVDQSVDLLAGKVCHVYHELASKKCGRTVGQILIKPFELAPRFERHRLIPRYEIQNGEVIVRHSQQRVELRRFLRCFERVSIMAQPGVGYGQAGVSLGIIGFDSERSLKCFGRLPKRTEFVVVKAKTLPRFKIVRAQLDSSGSGLNGLGQMVQGCICSAQMVVSNGKVWLKRDYTQERLFRLGKAAQLKLNPASVVRDPTRYAVSTLTLSMGVLVIL